MNAAYTYSYLQQLKLYIIKRWCDATVWINFCLQNRYASTLNWLFWLVGWLVPQKSKARKPLSFCTYIWYIRYTIPVPGGTYQSVSTVHMLRNMCHCHRCAGTNADFCQCASLSCQEHYVNRIHVAPSRSSRLIDPFLISGILNEKVLPIKIHQEPNIRGSIQCRCINLEISPFRSPNSIEWMNRL